jgi:hypothetical protein
MMPRINGLIDPITVVGTRGTDGTTKPQQLNRVTEVLTVTDDNSQNMTLAAEDIKGGINVHTSVTGGGTVTCDTAANIISKVPLTEDDQCIVSYYINDGDQTATFAVASGTTIADVGNTVLTNEAAVLLWRRTSSTAVVLYIVSS